MGISRLAGTPFGLISRLDTSRLRHRAGPHDVRQRNAARRERKNLAGFSTAQLDAGRAEPWPSLNSAALDLRYGASTRQPVSPCGARRCNGRGYPMSDHEVKQARRD